MEVPGIEYTNTTYIGCFIFCTILWNWIPFKYAPTYVLDYGDYLPSSLCMDCSTG